MAKAAPWTDTDTQMRKRQAHYISIKNNNPFGKSIFTSNINCCFYLVIYSGNIITAEQKFNIFFNFTTIGYPIDKTSEVGSAVA